MGGYPLLGYDCKDRKLVINEKEAEVVRFIYEQFQLLESCTMVSDALNRSGRRTKLRKHVNDRNCGGKLYAPKDVRRILQNPYYKGCVTHKGNVYEGEHKAIIDEERWREVQEIFARHAKDAKVKHVSSFQALLSGLVRCASCDCLMTASSSRKNGAITYRYYKCSKHAKYKTCGALYKNLPAETLEKHVVDEVLRIARSPEVVMKINELAAKQSDAEKIDFLNALKNLKESWDYLYLAEKRKILRMLIKSVDVMDEGIKINLNLEDFDGFLIELAA
jgi:hypothetical protein